MIRTAVDTSVLLDVFGGDPQYGGSSLAAIQRCWEAGILLACDVVWAELRPRFENEAQLLAATGKLGVEYEPTSREAAFRAGEAWKEYRAHGGRRERMVPDFLIAAFGLIQTDQLLTRDRGFYRRYFPKLKIVIP